MVDNINNLEDYISTSSLIITAMIITRPTTKRAQPLLDDWLFTLYVNRISSGIFKIKNACE